MQDLPHHYAVSASASAAGTVALETDGVEELASQAPAEFGGPGGYWSPESLLVAAVADCFVLSFRAIARASRLDWNALSCNVVGTLDRVERVMQFTDFAISAELAVPAGTDVDKAKRLLDKAEQACLITNSLKAESHLEASVSAAS